MCVLLRGDRTRSRPPKDRSKIHPLPHPALLGVPSDMPSACQAAASSYGCCDRNSNPPIRRQPRSESPAYPSSGTTGRPTHRTGFAKAPAGARLPRSAVARRRAEPPSGRIAQGATLSAATRPLSQSAGRGLLEPPHCLSSTTLSYSYRGERSTKQVRVRAQ